MINQHGLKNLFFYVSVPSLTDNTLAPEGHENVFILIPLAPGLEDNEKKDSFISIWL